MRSTDILPQTTNILSFYSCVQVLSPPISISSIWQRAGSRPKDGEGALYPCGNINRDAQRFKNLTNKEVICKPARGRTAVLTLQICVGVSPGYRSYLKVVRVDQFFRQFYPKKLVWLWNSAHPPDSFLNERLRANNLTHEILLTNN